VRERNQFAAQIKATPRNFIAQPVIALSTVPTFVDDRIAPRHVDLRPFILSGPKTYVTTGGLTRVALREGSLVVIPHRAAAARTRGLWTWRPKACSRASRKMSTGWRAILSARKTVRASSTSIRICSLTCRLNTGPAGWLSSTSRQPRTLRQRERRIEERDIVNFLIADLDNPGSILASIRSARENARTLRDVLPNEVWNI